MLQYLSETYFHDLQKAYELTFDLKESTKTLFQCDWNEKQDEIRQLVGLYYKKACTRWAMQKGINELEFPFMSEKMEDILSESTLRVYDKMDSLPECELPKLVYQSIENALYSLYRKVNPITREMEDTLSAPQDDAFMSQYHGRLLTHYYMDLAHVEIIVDVLETDEALTGQQRTAQSRIRKSLRDWEFDYEDKKDIARYIGNNSIETIRKDFELLSK